MQIVGLVEVGIIHAGNVESFTVALDPGVLIQQYLIVHIFQPGQHAYAVVVAQHRDGTALNGRPQFFHAGQGIVDGPPGPLSVISG